MQLSNTKNGTLSIKWDVSMLNKLIGFTFKKNPKIKLLNLRNLQRLMNRCNTSMYKNRNIIYKRIQFLQDALTAILDERLEDEGLIIEYCTPDTEDTVIDDIVTNLDRYKRLNFREIEFIIKFIEDRLQFGVFVDKAMDFKRIIEKIEDDEFRTYSEANESIKQWIQGYTLKVRECSTNWNNGMLDFNSPDLKENVNNLMDILGDMRYMMVTGVQMLNEMLSPGFRPGKLYMILGTTGGYKSAMLLKIVIDCIKYNAITYKPKEESAHPYVVYFSMENTMDESFARIWNLAVDGSSVEKHQTDEIISRLKDAKIIENERMGLIVIYRPNMSITTADLRDIIVELESSGKEICLLSFDYIKRIRPQLKAKDEKEQLKNVTNELRNIADEFGFPVVAAHQYNRSALAIVNTGKRNGEADLAKLIGGENVGSAYEVMENADMTLSLIIERRRSDNRLFLTINLLKSRYKRESNLDYFNQPFQEDNEFALVDDILDNKPAGVMSLSTDLENVDVNSAFSSRGRTKHRNLNAIMDKNVITDDIFDLDPL